MKLRYKTIGLLYTRTCPLQCRHCIIESSPKATGKMEKSRALDYLRTISKHSDETCFTGGEPMLYFNEVVELTRHAREMGLRVGMVSGAGWVRLEKANIVRDRMRALFDAGLGKLCISWDQYHEEFSPRAQAELLAEVASDEGIDVVVRGVVAANWDGERPEKAFGKYQPQFQSLIRLGSARSLPEEQFLHLEMPEKGGCNVVLTPAIEPDGNVYACCGPARFSREGSPLYLGNTNEESLEEILCRGENDPILNAIYLVGPTGLHLLMQKVPGYDDIFPRRASYNGVCDLCVDMTGSPAVVAALRQRLTERDANALLVAAQMMAKQNQLIEMQTALLAARANEVVHVD